MADRMLVSGAGQVARAEGTGKLAAAEGATDVAGFIAEGTAVVVQSRNREFNKAMKDELARNPGLTDEAYDKLYKKLKRKRFDYVYLNKRGRVKAEQDLVKEAEVIQKTEVLKNEIANTEIENPEKDLGPCNAAILKDIVSGESEFEYNEDNKPMYKISARPCFADDESNPELNEFVEKDSKGNPTIKSYEAAWDDDRFTVSEDGKTKTDKFGNSYSNDEQGLQDFIDSSEKYWKKQQDKNPNLNLDLDSQTNKKSTNAAFKKVSSPFAKTFGAGEAKAVVPKQEATNSPPKNSEQYMTIEEIQEMVKEGGVDKKSFSSLETLITEAASDAKNRQIGENSQFNHFNYFNSIKNNIVKNGNLRSIATNTNPFGRVFANDLEESILKGSYEKMGLNTSQVDNMDPTPETPITAEDARQISQLILDDKEMLTDYVSEYYTNFAEQNFNANLKPEVAQDFSTAQSFEEAKAMATRRFGNGKNFTYQGQRFTTDAPVASTQEDSEDEFA